LSMACASFCRVFGLATVLLIAFALHTESGVRAAFTAAILVKIYLTLVVDTDSFLKDLRYAVKGSSIPSSGDHEVPFPHLPEDDHVAKVCKTSIYVKLAEEALSGLMMTPFTDKTITLPPTERVQSYVSACRHIYENLPPDCAQRKVLDSLVPVPEPSQFVVNVTHPWLNGRFTEEMLDRTPFALGNDRFPANVWPAGTERTWEKERLEAADAYPSIETRLKPEEQLKKLPDRVRRGLVDLGIRPVRDDWVDVGDIPDALLNGRTVLFDATKLCGKEVFNLTVPDIARLHGDMAKTIPAFKVNSAAIGDNTYDSLAQLAQRFADWDKKGLQHFPDYGPFPDASKLHERDARATPQGWWAVIIDRLLAQLAKTQGKDTTAEEVAWQATQDMNEYRRMNTQTTVNVKRLPMLPLADMQKSMGNPSWVDRFFSLLWIGPVMDFWHFDEWDNLLICISGELFVAVLEQDVTDLVSRSRYVNMGWNNLMPFFVNRSGGDAWIDRNPWMRKLPIHFVKLEPGMGITVPSRTYHNVMALDGNRVLMNNFFQPKYKALQDAPYAKHSFWKPGNQADTWLAMFHLKLSSIGRLWDGWKTGGFFVGYKLEFL